MVLRLSLLLSFLTSLLLLSPPAARAQWTEDGLALAFGGVNVTLDGVRSVGDDQGGSFVVWVRWDIGHADTYAQRLGPGGETLWSPGGVPVTDLPTSYQNFPDLVADGQGGCYVVWTDTRGSEYKIYGQHLSPDGAPLWAANGIPLFDRAGDQTSARVCADGEGGLLVVCEDGYYGYGDTDVSAQRVDPEGVLLWYPYVVVANPAADQYKPQIASDGEGGAFVVWLDDRYGTGAGDLFAQRLGPGGGQAWPYPGIAVCTAAGYADDLVLRSGGVSGFHAAWADTRGGDFDIYVQRVDREGSVLWTPDGVPVCVEAQNQMDPSMERAGDGSVLLAWTDHRRINYPCVYAQRVNDAGYPLWLEGGAAVSDDGNGADQPRVGPVEEGAAWVVAYRYNGQALTGYDVDATRLELDASLTWMGSVFCEAPQGQTLAGLHVDPGGLVASWIDLRSGREDLYVNRIDGRHGEWGRPEPTLLGAADIPGDEGGWVDVRWLRSARDAYPDVLIDSYRVWRSLTAPEGDFVLVDDPGAPLPDDGRRLVWSEGADALSGKRAAFWECVGTVEALHREAYALRVATAADSTAADPALEWFQVTSHAYWAQEWWASGPLPGWSTDDLAPPAPAALSAQRAGGDVVDLAWTLVQAPADFSHYRLYRATTAGVPRDEAHLLAQTADSLWTDASADPTSWWYYVVEAVDVHGNPSPASPEASVTPATGGVDLPGGLVLAPCRPNPFSASTTLRFALPRPSAVRVRFFDAAGRQVAERRLTDRPAGWQTLLFDGRDDGGRPLAGGVYFYRLEAAGVARADKVVLRR